MTFDTKHAKKLCDVLHEYAHPVPSTKVSHPLEDPLGSMVLMLEQAVERIEELEGIVAENNKRWLAWMNTTDQRTVEKLEKALIEERASRIIEGSHEGCPVPDEEIVSPDTDCECWKDLEHCPESKYFRKKAREQLQSGGML